MASIDGVSFTLSAGGVVPNQDVWTYFVNPQLPNLGSGETYSYSFAGTPLFTATNQNQKAVGGQTIVQTTDVVLGGTDSLLTALSAGENYVFNIYDTVTVWSKNIVNFDDSPYTVIYQQHYTITFTGVNDAPVLGAGPSTLGTIASSQTSTQTVSTILGSSVSDPDHGAVQGMAITAASSPGGQWQYSLDAGTTWTSFGSVSASQALLLRPSDEVRFVSTAPAADTPTLSYHAWDQTTGSAGQTADLSTSGSTGGTTAFSTAADTVSLTVTHVNSSPSLGNVQSVTAASVERTAALLDVHASISDPELDYINNYQGASLTVARHGGASADDSFGFNTSGASFTTSGGNLQSGGLTFATYTVSGGALTINFTGSGTAATSTLVNNVLGNITYVDTSHNPPAQVSLDYQFSDGNSGAQGTGGVGNATGTVTVNITAVDDPPTVSGLPAINSNYVLTQAAAVRLAPGLAVSDLDDSSLAGAVVKIDNATFVAGDQLSVGLPTTNGVVNGTNIHVSYDGNGTLTLSGADTVANYAIVMGQVDYSSTAGPSSAGANQTRTISWVANDGHPGGTGTAVLSHVNVIGVTVAMAPIATDNVVNAAEAAAGVAISGTTTDVEDGQSVQLVLLNASNQTVTTLTAPVSNGTWSALVPGTQWQALPDGSYSLTADVADRAGDAAPPMTRSFTIDETAPAATAAQVYAIDGSTSRTTGDYGANHVIQLQLTANDLLQVTGAPQLLLNDGGIASYLSGSGSNKLIFSYTTHKGENTADLKVSSLALNGGAITDASGNPVVATGIAGADLGLMIDTVAPSIAINSLPGGNVITIAEAVSGMTLSGTTVGVEDGQTVSVFLGNTSGPASATAKVSGGKWTVNLSSSQLQQAPGSFSIEATVADKAGNPAPVAVLPVTDQATEQAAAFPKQASLVLTDVMELNGVPPNGTASYSLGMVRTFATSYAPNQAALLLGGSLSLNTYSNLGFLLNGAFGYSGTNFNLPNLGGRVIVGANNSGDTFATPVNASETTALTAANLPVSRGGLGTAIDNTVPALPLTYLIRTAGLFPTSGAAEESFIGQVIPFAGPSYNLPTGFLPANGQLLNIASNTALFQVLGTTYGGNGTTTFALPNLSGRDIVGTDNGFGLGTVVGASSTTLSNANLPSSYGGSGQSINTEAPGLELNYLIKTTGLYPSYSGSGTLDYNASYISEITAFAGPSYEIPAGWLLANGALLQISQYINLFSVIGTTYGGDGITTFALPNLSGKVVVDAGSNASNYDSFGTSFGQNTVTLAAGNVPDNPPVITLTGPTLPVEATSSAGADVTITATASDQLDGTRTVTLSEVVGGHVEAVTSGQAFALGSHTITASSSDAHGHTSTGTITFSVVDTTAPTVTASAAAASVQETSPVGAVETFTASASDLVDGSSDPIVFTEQLAGGGTKSVHSGDTFALGTHTITASATDGANNTGSTTFSFSVVDNPPTATIVVADTTLTAGTTSPVTITFSEAVTGFSNADLTVANGSLSAVLSTDGGITWSATLTPAGNTLNASNVITLDASKIFNLAGTPGSGTVESNSYGVDTPDQVTISGSPLDAHVLTATTSGDPNATISYQWESSNDDFTTFKDIGTNASTYQIVHGDDGSAIRVVATFTNGPATIVTSDPTGEVVACYCRGTLICTDRGELPVEDLTVGDQVLTFGGALRPVKWIGTRSYGGRFIMGRKDILPVCFTAGSLGDNLPKRDLRISPHHAMYFANEGGGVLVEAKDLVNGVSIMQAEKVEEVEYFHIELETHDVILAEGALSESFVDDDSRSMFHNAHEYAELYPEDIRPAARYCAPRLEIGYEVEAIRRKLAKRAGSLPVGEEAGTLRGYIDAVSPRLIEGWAQSVDHPEAPVCLDVYAGRQLIGQTLANRYRHDLEAAGLGSGRHSFSFTVPDGLMLLPGTVEVRRSLDGMALGCSIAANVGRAEARRA